VINSDIYMKSKYVSNAGMQPVIQYIWLDENRYTKQKLTLFVHDKICLFFPCDLSIGDVFKDPVLRRRYSYAEFADQPYLGEIDSCTLQSQDSAIDKDRYDSVVARLRSRKLPT
jgi:hypothetical protein